MNAVVAPLEPTRGVCDLTRLEVQDRPFPHVVHEQFIRPELYRQLTESFPACPPTPEPTGYSLLRGDEGYERLPAAPKRVRPRPDLMVAFPCSARSHHPVGPVAAQDAPRNYIQVQISSPADIWHDARSSLDVRPREEDKSRSRSYPSARPASLEPTPEPFDLEAGRDKLLGTLEGADDLTVIRSHGNIGDRLIHAGMRRLLDEHLNSRSFRLLSVYWRFERRLRSRGTKGS